jgi:hypothetical protein
MEQRVRSPAAAVASCALVGSLLMACGGCGGGATPDQKVEKQLSALGKAKVSVCPFAGKVLVDGHPPQLNSPQSRVVLVLFDRAKPDLPVTQRPQTICNPQGEFTFTTYVREDGVEPADYVVTVAQLSKEKGRSYSGPDGFQNLYNDPDANEKDAELTVKHAAPGKTNYVFDLKLAGRQPESTAGPRAVTQVLLQKPD